MPILRRADMHRRYGRREFLQLAGGVAASATLAACQPTVIQKTVQVEQTVEVPVEVQSTVEVEKIVEVTAPPEAKTLTILWDNWGDFFNALMEEIGKSYTEEHPEVTVEWTFEPGYLEPLLTELASGDTHDVFYALTRDIISLAYQGAFLPLDAFLVTTGLKRGDFLPGQYDSCVWDGKLYALPGGSNWSALYYNISVMEDAGINAPPATTSDLVEQSLKILQKDQAGAITRIGWSPSSWEFPQWAWLFGGEWYDDGAQKLTPDHPKNVEALEWMSGYVAELDVNQMAAFMGSLPGFWSPGNTFETKQTSFVFDGFWTYDPLDQYAPDIKYGVAFWPTQEGKPEDGVRHAERAVHCGSDERIRAMYGRQTGARQPDDPVYADLDPDCGSRNAVLAGNPRQQTIL
jgi:ABC-type glycerol-3-phosphate transport system substrate-binding protein